MLPRAWEGRTTEPSDLIYLSLGSNLGDREKHLNNAITSLATQKAIKVIGCSSFYETAPQDVSDQPWFLNMAVAIATDLPPVQLLSDLQTIERMSGRDRKGAVRRGPRTLDIDILLYGSLVMDTDQLTLPHPRLSVRRFALEPLLELAPDVVHPGSGVALRAYLSATKGQPLRKICLR